MSISLMALAWKAPLASNHKLAMLALCDWANDAGESLHPSIRAIAQRVSVSDRQAQRIIHTLISEGWVSVIGNENGGAPGSSRQYRLNVQKLTQTGDTGVTGDKLSRVTPVTQTGDTGDVRRVTPVTQTGDTGVTQTTIEPSIEPPKNPHPARGAPPLPADVPASLWADFLAVRKAAKAPLTQTALDGIKREAAKAEMSLSDVLSLCCERGWRGFNASWVSGAAGPAKKGAAPDKHGGFAERTYVGTDPKSIEWA